MFLTFDSFRSIREINRLIVEPGTVMEIMKSVPVKRSALPPLSKKNRERVYRVQRGLSVGSEELYKAVLERSEMSTTEAKLITDEHSLLFKSIWRYWLYTDSRLNILDSMRYSSLLSWLVFFVFILPIWIWNSIERWELLGWVKRIVRDRLRKKTI